MNLKNSTHHKGLFYELINELISGAVCNERTSTMDLKARCKLESPLGNLFSLKEISIDHCLLWNIEVNSPQQEGAEDLFMAVFLIY